MHLYPEFLATPPSESCKNHKCLILVSILVLMLIPSCTGVTQRQKEPVSHYEYRVGLGYGFLGKAVQVTIDGEEVISIIGTREIEQYAQLLGTKMLDSGSAANKDIIVQVIIDDSQPFEQAIDLNDGMFIHIYYEQTGLHIYNTRFLIEE